MNIVSAVSQFLTPDLIAKMASAAGISDRTTAQKAVGAAVPAILSSLANLASNPAGAQQLAGTIAKQPTNMLEGLSSMIGGSGQLADTGKSLLSSLLGSSSFSSLAKTIGRFAGVGEGVTGSILGMLTPVILGVLGREAGAGASGLTQLLASQKDSIAAAMPAGLSDLMRTSGLNNRIGSVAAAASRADDTYRASRDTEGSMVHAMNPTRSASSSNWMYWALPILALAGFAWYLLSGDGPSRPVAVAPQATSTVQGPAVGGDLGRQVTAVIDSLNTLLPGVKDQASVNEALPKLQRAASELDQLSGLADRLPVDSRDKLAEAIKAATARVKSGLDNVSAIPGLAPNAKPVVAALRTKLDALAMTPGSLAQQRITAFVARAQSDSISVSTYFDRSVYNGAGEKIGTVSDLIVGPDAKIVAAVIGVGGFLGIGEKEVAVPFSSVQVNRRDNEWHLVMNATKDSLEAAPKYEDSGLRVRLSPAPSQK
jgi:sporulation protein YlmC with PRC-barrel domain